MQRAHDGAGPRGAARHRAIAAGAAIALLLALAVLFLRGSRDSALEPGVALGAGERAHEQVVGSTVPASGEAAPAREDASGEPQGAVSLALCGRVLDEAGAPVAGAAVDARAERPEGPAIAGVRTQASGDFELRVEDAGCTYGLRIVAEGFYPTCVEAVLPGSALAVVTLRAAPSLHGRVSSTAGRPIAGARVRLVAQTEFGEVLELETTSDESGKYRLAAGLLDLEHLENPLLEASAEGFAPSRVHLRDFAWLLTRAPGLTALERDLVLSRGNRFAGRVVDDSGVPVADAELVAFTHTGGGLFRDPYGTVRSSGLGPTAIATTRSAADGSFALDGLPTRTGDGTGAAVAGDEESSMGSVRARKEGFAFGGAHLPWTKEGEPTEPLEIVLARGASFRGRVVDEHGEPLDEVNVGFGLTGVPLSPIVPNGRQPEGYGELIFWPPPKEGAASHLWVRTGADGRFRSPVLPCWSDAGISARTRVSWRHEYGEWRDLALSAGEARDLGDLVFERRHLQVPIEGVVLDPAGAPVAGAEVELQDAGVRRAGRDGRFRFEHALEPGAEFPALDLEVRARGFVAHREVLRAAPEGPLEINLAAGLELHGTLSFQDGSPAAFGTVRFARPPQADSGPVGSDRIGWTTCDALGRFALRELCPPPWIVFFRVERLGFELEDRLTVLEPCDELALVLPGEPPEFAALELDVTDANARPIEAVSRPTLASDAATIEGLRRDARTIVFPQVASGAYELRLNATGFAPHTQALELAPGERARVQVTLEVGAPVNVRVTPRPHMQLRVVAESAQHGTRGGEVEPIGLAKLGVLAPGTWTVGLVAKSSTDGVPAWLGAPRSFEVANGDAPLEWTLECPELGRVRLVVPVHGPDDPPLPVAEPDMTADGSLAANDQHQAWWNALYRSERRARELTIELEDSTGAVVLRTTPEHVYLDTEHQRVLGSITAPVGKYTLVLRRGTETLRRAPVQVLAETTVELDP